MTDLTEQQREALEALDRLEHDSDYAEWEDRPEDDVLYGANTLRDRDTIRTYILNSTPVPEGWRSTLWSIHSALDDASGDSDVDWIESDEELRTEEPVQWAAKKLSTLLLEASPKPEDSHD